MSSMASPPVFHDEFKELPSWPTIIGVISCVWGGITLLYNGCCQLGGSLVGKAFMGAMPPEFQDQMKAQMAMIGPIDIAFMLVLTLISVLLLVAAILLVRRKPIAAKFHITYGIIAVLVLLAHIAWGVYRSSQVAQMMKQNTAAAGNNPMAGFANMSETMLIVLNVVMGILRLVYPVFCLIWFGYVKKNADMGSNEVSI